MINLTEQWKKGELKSGWYFVKVGKYEVEIDLYDDDQNQWFNCCDKDIYPPEVLAPVPSYDHFVELTEKDKENEKLKSILNDVDYFFTYGIARWGVIDLRRSVKEVLK